jgi:transcriptional regulator with XRE-family HTH domain
MVSSVPPPKQPRLIAKLQALMAAKGLSERRLAEMLGLEGPDQIKHWLKGRRRLTVDSVRRVAAQLGVEVSELDEHAEAWDPSDRSGDQVSRTRRPPAAGATPEQLRQTQAFLAKVIADRRRINAGELDPLFQVDDPLLDKLRAALSIVRDVYGEDAARDWVEEAQRRAAQWKAPAEVVPMPTRTTAPPRRALGSRESGRRSELAAQYGITIDDVARIEGLPEERREELYRAMNAVVHQFVQGSDEPRRKK